MPTRFDQQLAAADRLAADGEPQQAAALYQQVLAAHPDNLRALYSYASLSRSTGHPELAVQLLTQAIENDSGQAPVWLELGRALRQSGQTQKARHAIQKALQLNPADPAALLESGHLCSDRGETTAAIDAYCRALAQDADCIEAYYSLSFLHQTGDYVFSADQLEHLDRLLTQALSAQRKALLYFTLGRIQHRAGDYAAAFASFTQANQAQRQSQQDWERFDLAARQDLLRRSREVFAGNPLPRPGDSGGTRPGPTPVFIIGMPRSGSTLLESCLARHPQMAAAGESAAIKNIARRQLLQATGKAYPEQLLEMPAELAHMAARHVLQQYQKRIGAERMHKASLIIDKMPTNFEYLGLIARLFPHAPVIHLRRDPIDTLWSCYQQNLAARYSNDFADLEGQYRCYRGFMELWRSLELPMLELDYETLAGDFEASLRNVIDYLQLDWDAACLDTGKADAAITTASRMQVRKPVHTGAIGAWHKYAEQLTPLRERMADFYA